MNTKRQHRVLRLEQCEPRHLLATVIGPVPAEDLVVTDVVAEVEMASVAEPLPQVSTFRSADQSAANVHEIALGILNYESANTKVPAHAIYDRATNEPLLSWRVSILPFLGYRDLYYQFDQTEAWDSPHNLSLLASMPDIYRSPQVRPPIPNTGPISDISVPFNPPSIPNTGPISESMDPFSLPLELRVRPTTNTVYQVMLGEGTMFPERESPPIGLRHVSDGLGNTVLVVETTLDHAVPWTKPADIRFDPADPLNGLVTDTSVEFHVALTTAENLVLPGSVNMELWTNLVLRDDGQFVDLNQIAPPFQPADAIRSLGLGILNFESVYSRLPGPAIVSNSGQPLLSWRVSVLPFLEQQALYEMFHLNEPWDSEHNLSLLPMMPRTLWHADVPRGKTNCLAFVGENTVFPATDNGLRVAAIRDGTSGTILFAEADPIAAVEWTRPVDINFNPDAPLDGVGNVRETSFHVVVASGVVRAISNSISPDEFRQLVIINDGVPTLYLGEDEGIECWEEPVESGLALFYGTNVPLKATYDLINLSHLLED